MIVSWKNSSFELLLRFLFAFLEGLALIFPSESTKIHVKIGNLILSIYMLIANFHSTKDSEGVFSRFSFLALDIQNR
jgi:hypothetical protein